MPVTCFVYQPGTVHGSFEQFDDADFTSHTERHHHSAGAPCEDFDAAGAQKTIKNRKQVNDLNHSAGLLQSCELNSLYAVCFALRRP